MKVTFLSNDTNRYIRLLNDFAKCCRKFVSICKGISHILDMLSLCELQDVINDSHKFEAAFLSVVELRTLLDELAEIQLEANNTLTMLSSTNRLISSVTTEQGKVSLVELGTLVSCKIQKTECNVKLIPCVVRN